MNFEFSDEQNQLRDQAQSFLSDNCPPEKVRKILEGEEPYDKQLWQSIADLGWLSTVIPENHGGLGLSYYELVVIAEELGRVLAPVPFSSSVYLASEAILQFGSDAQKQKWLPRFATGEAIGTFAFGEGAGRPSPASLEAVATDHAISGTKYPVPDGDVADVAIVVTTCQSGDGASLYLVDLSEVQRDVVSTLDPSRSHALFAWEQVGGSQAALEQAKAYAMERYAFGRPIAGFQAIKHKLANVYVKNTLARSNCYYGTWALDENNAELALAAATARVSSTQAFYFASKENIQTHGGMGFTWEFDCQFPYRRAKLLSVNIGSESWWQDRLITAYEQSNQADAA